LLGLKGKGPWNEDIKPDNGTDYAAAEPYKATEYEERQKELSCAGTKWHLQKYYFTR